MSFRILAVQRNGRWQLKQDDETLPHDPNQRFTVAISGFISNLDELERDLGSANGRRATAGLRLARLLEHAGCELLHQLRGNYALLVNCTQSGNLWARRDRLGAHSMYLARQSRAREWVVGNSAADVFKASGHELEEDPRFIASYFSRHGEKPIGRSPFGPVQALAPGEVITLQGEECRRTRVAIAMSEVACPPAPADAVERFRTLLERSVGLCLGNSTRAAAMLSGGMDSGPMAVIADRACARQGHSLVPISWTLQRFPECDEARWIEQFGAQLSEPVVTLESSDLLPFSDFATFPVNAEAPGYNAFRGLVNRCYQTAAQHGCSVILNGNAGDELYHPFALLYLGYIRHREWGPLGYDLKQTIQRNGLSALWRYLPLEKMATRPFSGLRQAKPPPWLTDSARYHWAPLEPWPPEVREHPFPEFAQQLYGRRMASGRAVEHFQSTALGVERRDPYHNEELVEFMLNAPFSFSYRNRRTKWIMREAMRGQLPDPVRLKPRTGLLGAFYRKGLAEHRASLADFLFRQHREWQRWVKPDAVRSALASPQPDAPDTLVARCIGYVRWLHYWRSP